MLKSLFQFLSKLVGNGAARVLTGAGLSVVSYAAISTACIAALSAAVNNFNNLGTDVLNIVLLCGVGETISIIGAALLTAAAIRSGSLGITKT